MISTRHGLLAVAAVAAGLVLAAPSALAANATLTNADDDRSVSAALGDTVRVNLTAREDQGLRWEWQVPTSSDADVLHRTAGRTTPDGGAAATFEAVEPGTATLTAQATCKPVKTGAKCPSTARSWKVTVQVR